MNRPKIIDAEGGQPGSGLARPTGRGKRLAIGVILVLLAVSALRGGWRSLFLNALGFGLLWWFLCRSADEVRRTKSRRARVVQEPWSQAPAAPSGAGASVFRAFLRLLKSVRQRSR